MSPISARPPSATVLLGLALGLLAACTDAPPPEAVAPDLKRGDVDDRSHARPDPKLVAEGKEIFRYDTFGDEVFWTDTLRMHEVVETVDPLTALALGLKVDLDAIPPEIQQAIANGEVDLTDPAVTLALLSLDAVVGLKGKVVTVDGRQRLESLGVTCALCHSTVNDAFAPGIGQRLDGWPNRDLDVGRIIATSPALQDPAVQEVLLSWGPGMYDAYWNLDGRNDPTVIPPAYGLRHVELETFTGEGPVSYWNAYVAVTQMHGQGNFSDPKLGIDVRNDPDLVTPRLPALREYQRSLEAPRPPAGSFDQAAARRGRAVFASAGTCVSCHIGPAFTDVERGLHAPSETGMDPTLAERATTGMYRTTPLRGAWHRAPYFHDGSAATLDDVVRHYDRVLQLGLSERQQRDLVEYLKSL